jgi:hypothetical protein
MMRWLVWLKIDVRFWIDLFFFFAKKLDDSLLYYLVETLNGQ